MVSLGYVGAAAVLDVGVLAHEDMAVWQRTWEVNVLGNVLALRELLPLLTSAEYAAVVAVSSINAQFGEQQLAAYSSSKAALTSAVRTIALDYARHGVRVNILAPGPMRAGLFERHLASATDPARFLATRRGSPTHRPAPRGGRGGTGGRIPALVGGLGPIRQHIDRRRRVDG